MKKTSFLSPSIVIAFCVLASAMSATALSVEIHATSERSGAQGNLLKIVARHTGTFPVGAEVLFYAVDGEGLPGYIGKARKPDNLGYWRLDWIATKPANYQVYAIMKRNSLASSAELAKSDKVSVKIVGSALEIDESSAISGAQGNVLKIVARHSGTVPSGAEVLFYAVNGEGLPGYIGKARKPDNLGYWRLDWIATKPANYQLYAILKRNSLASSAELAITDEVSVKIVGSAIKIDESSDNRGSTGTKTKIVVRQTGTVPNGAEVLFYAVDGEGMPGYIGKARNSDNLDYWRLDWIATIPATYQIYAILRQNSLQSSAELARTGTAPLLVTSIGVKPSPVLPGTYQALLSGDKRPMIMVQVTRSGALSGRFSIDGLDYAFKKQLESDGTASITIKLRNQLSLNILLQYDISSKMMTGSYQFAGQQPITFTLMLPAYVGTGANVSPLSKKTANALLVSESNGTNPLGHGYFRATFDAKGGARVAGKMPDGRRLTGYAPALGTGVAGETTLPLSVVWKGKALATLIGDLEVRENAGESAPLLEGAVEWNAPADPKRKVLPEAIQADFTVVGNLWAPVAGRNPLTSTGESVNFTFQADSGANILGTALSAGGSLGTAAQPAISGLPAGTKWKYTPKTGIFTGQIPGSPGRLVFEGLLVPRSELTVDGNLLFGGGFLIGKGGSAPVEILEAD